ncbi:MAG: histone deacetylase [Planctomycetes bacterium]|nr:histone deacetylase [Planctomycetota bacterium]
MSNTGLVLDDVFTRHLTGPAHPERPQRLERIATVLEGRGLCGACRRIAPNRIDPHQLQRVHSDVYTRRLIDACAQGAPYIDTPDSGICSQSYDIASLAAGSVVEAVDLVMAGEIQNAFCAVRPPGHHAEHDRSMGFCLFNNVVLAVDRLRNKHGLRRVLILDWDVHHGNGTQHLLEEDPDAMFISIHGHPDYVYPGTGFAKECGRRAGLGATLNVPMMPMSGDKEYRRAFDQHIQPVLESFAAEFVLVSAGFDAHRLDPLAPLNLETDSYEWMTRLILDAADHHCRGRLVSLLEGGYHLDALADSVATHLSLLIDRANTPS